MRKNILGLIVFIIMFFLNACQDTQQIYKVTFKDYDHSILAEHLVEAGGDIITELTPSREGYEFIGWDQSLEHITSNIDVYAQYTINFYEVVWVDSDGTILDTEQYAWQALPNYKGSTPIKETIDGVAYSFIGWDQPLDHITSHVTYVAQYLETPLNYEITWQNDDGTILQLDHLMWGALPIYNGDTPIKANDVYYRYEFIGWDKHLSLVESHEIYTAVYKQVPMEYKVFFTYEDGTIIETHTLQAYEVPTYHGYIPQKASTSAYDYVFDGWDKPFSEVLNDQVYIATFKEVPKTYEVVWKNHDDMIFQIEAYHWLETPHYSGVQPEKPSSEQYDYIFIGWDREIQVVQSDQTYIAVFEAVLRTYEIIWLNYDDTVLEKTNYHWGETPHYHGETPTKESSLEYSYIFGGWSPALDVVIKDQTYKAVFDHDINSYEITWLNYDGSVIQTDRFNFGEVPKYLGPTPVKPANQQYSYQFEGWSPLVSTVVSDQVFTAIFSQTTNIYHITLKNLEDEIINEVSLPYGSIPSFDIPHDSAEWQYSISPEIEYVHDHQTYILIQEKQVYQISFISDDETIYPMISLEYGDSFILPTPTKAGYYFSHWSHMHMSSTDLITVTDHMVFEAIWYETTEFSFEDDEAYDGISITGYLGTQTDITIPTTINGKHVTTIKANAFFNNQQIQKVTIPKRIVQIGAHAFDGATLETIIFENASNLTTIGDYAFANTQNLKRIDLPKKLLYLGAHAFYKSKVQGIYFEQNSILEIIGPYTFYKTDALEFISLPQSIQLLGAYAFSYSSLSDPYVISNTRIKIIPEYAFYGVTRLHSIHIPDSVEIIESYAFAESSIETLNYGQNSQIKIIDAYAMYKANLTHVEFPNSLEYIGSFAFADTKITEIQFDEETNLNQIDSYAFANNISLTTFILPVTIENISAYILSGAYNLESLTIQQMAWYQAQHIGYYFDNTPFEYSYEVSFILHEYIDVLFYIPNQLKHIKLLELEHINSHMFYGLQNIESIELDETVQTIGQRVFGYTPNLKSISLPQGLEQINPYAFMGSGIEHIEIPKNLVNISPYTFYGAKNLKSIYLHQNIESIGSYAFEATSNLLEVFFEGDLNLKILHPYQFSGLKQLKSYTIPNTVTEMMPYAFAGSYIETLKIDKDISIKNFVQYSFSDMLHLKHFEMDPELSDVSFATGSFTGTKFIESMDLSIALNVSSMFNVFISSATGEVINLPSKLTTITIRNGTNLPAYAFSNLTHLKEVHLPATLQSIGAHAFYNAKHLMHIELPNSLAYIGDHAFENTSSLEKLRLGENLNHMGQQAFKNSGIKQLEIDDLASITELDQTFSNAIHLSFIQLPTQLVHIGDRTFENTQNLIEIEIPSSVQKISSSAFENSGIYKVVFKNDSNLQELGDSAFKNAYNLTEMRLPDSLEIIKDNAFAHTKIKEVYLGKLVYQLDKHTFSNMKYLKSFHVDNANNHFKVIDGVLYDIDSEVLIKYPNHQAFTTYVVPATVKHIEAFAFEYAPLTSIIFEEGSLVDTIEANTFVDMQYLEYLYLPSSMSHIDPTAFIHTSALKEIHVDNHNPYYKTLDGVLYNKSMTNLIKYPSAKMGETYELPHTVTALSAYAFFGARHMTNLEIPNHVEDIGIGAFGGMENLESLTVPFIGGNAMYAGMSSAMGYVFGQIRYNNAYQVTHVIIPFTRYYYVPIKLKEIIVTHARFIAADAFYDFKHVERIVINEGITTIPRQAFSNTSALKSFTIPQSVSRIDDLAFTHSGIESLVIPKDVMHIGFRSFSNMSRLETLYFETGSKLEVLGNNAFSYNDQLKDIVFAKGIQKILTGAFGEALSLETLYIPDSVIEIGSGAFYNATQLKTLRLSENLITIGSNAFYNAKQLSSLYIPNSVVSIESGAFSGMHALTELHLSSNLKTIGDSSFSNAHKLKTLSIPRSVELIGDFAFSQAYALEDIIFEPESMLQSMGALAFADNQSLEKLTLPVSLQHIGEHALQNTVKLKYIHTPFLGYSRHEGRIIDILGEHTNIEEIILHDIESINDYAFEGINNITEVTIPDRVKRIGSFAFSNTKIQTINFPENGQPMIFDTYAFANIQYLTTFIVPNYVTKIEAYAFSNTPITNFEFENNSRIETISDFGLANMKHVRRIEIPNSLTNLGRSIFYKNEKLTHITIPFIGRTHSSNAGFRSLFNLDGSEKPSHIKIVEITNASTIYTRSLSNIDYVESIILPDTLVNIQPYSFENTTLNTLHIPNSVQVIEDFAFRYASIKNILFDEDSQLRSIGSYAFSNMDQLQELSIPKFVNELGRQIFINSNIERINFSNASVLSELDLDVFYGTNRLKKLTIPSSVERIFNHGFNSYQSSFTIEEISFQPHSKLIEIANSSFLGMDSLHTITIPKSLNMIQYSTFSGTQLKKIIFEEGSQLTVIGSFAFSDTQLEYIQIPSSVTTINGYAFYHNKHLLEVTFEPTSKLEYIGSHAFADTSIKKIVIPKSVTYIAGNAFANNPLLEHIDFEDNAELNEIGAYAFSNNPSIRRIELPISTQTIGHGILASNGNLTEVVLPSINKYTLSHYFGSEWFHSSYYVNGKYLPLFLEKVVFLSGDTMEDFAFSGAKYIREIILPNDLEHISRAAFVDTYNLKRIYIPSNVEYIEWNAFENSGIEEVIFELNSKLKTIHSRAFYNTYQLKSIHLPENLNKIQDEAFKNTIRLKDIVFPSTLYSIGYEAFKNSGFDCVEIL